MKVVKMNYCYATPQNEFSYCDCDTECRFFMLKSKINPPYIFKALPSFSRTPNLMKNALCQDLSFQQHQNTRSYEQL